MSRNYEETLPKSNVVYIYNNDEQAEKQELKVLLDSWNLKFLLEHLAADGVFIQVLKVIKRHHIPNILKKFNLGTQILFEHHLEQWRISIGMPLDDSLSQFSNPPPSPPTIISVSSPAPKSPTPPRDDNRYTPYSKKNSDKCDITLATILTNHPKGMMLVNYYDKSNGFFDEQRTSLINLIGQYFDEKCLSMSLANSYRLEQEILERFPTEKLEYYRSGKRGRIYNKFCNLKSRFKTVVSQPRAGEQNPEPKKTTTKETRLLQKFEMEEDAETWLRSLRYDKLTEEEFDNAWRSCCHYRLNDIKEAQHIKDILTKWHFYKKSDGFQLIEVDFQVAFPNAEERLLSKLDTWYDSLFTFLTTNNNVKERSIKTVLDDLKRRKTNENSKHAIVLWALHGYLVPTHKVVSNDEGKRKTTRFTIKDSQESFLYLGESMEDIEDHINRVKNASDHHAPFICCLGADLFSIQEIFVCFDRIRYNFYSFIRAVDICFKMFYVLDLPFPRQCSMFYAFLETFFYKLKAKNNYSKVHILAEQLDPTL